MYAEDSATTTSSFNSGDGFLKFKTTQYEVLPETFERTSFASQWKILSIRVGFVVSPSESSSSFFVARKLTKARS
jgi:hypothetical protein